MPAVTGLWRWGVLAALLLGLVFMHHVPSHHDHAVGHTPPHLVVASSAAAAPDAGAPTSTDCGCATHSLSAVLSHLLHLCLAIGAAAVLLLVPLLRSLRLRPAQAIQRGARAALENLPPPPPVPRRLAALGVLLR